MNAGASIGWIGLGAMGLPMAARLERAGHMLTLWARSALHPEVIDTLGDPPLAASPAELALRCRIVHTIVGGPSDVEAIYLGSKGLLAGALPGTILVDHTTSAPGLAARIAGVARKLGVATLDAPISGGPPAATDGTLAMMVGGPKGALRRVQPVLGLLAGTIVHHGPPGAGQAAKLANQVLVAGSMLAIADARRVGRGAGLDDAALRLSLGSGIAGSRLLDFAWSRAETGDRRPGFAIDHLIKDLALAVAMDPAMDWRLIELALSRYRDLARAGLGGQGTHVLLLDSESA